MALSEKGKRIIAGTRGRKPIEFKEGGEHANLGVKSDQPISAEKHDAARAGKYGALAKKEEIFRENVLTGGK